MATTTFCRGTGRDRVRLLRLKQLLASHFCQWLTLAKVVDLSGAAPTARIHTNATWVFDRYGIRGVVLGSVQRVRGRPVGQSPSYHTQGVDRNVQGIDRHVKVCMCGICGWGV